MNETLKIKKYRERISLDIPYPTDIICGIADEHEKNMAHALLKETYREKGFWYEKQIDEDKLFFHRLDETTGRIEGMRESHRTRLRQRLWP